MISNADLKVFTDAYITALLWSSVVEQDGEYISADEFQLSDAAAEKCRADCAAFTSAHCHIVGEAIEETDASQAGHDFALTRNRHGSGYWDRDEFSAALSDALTEAAQHAGEVDLYLNGDKVEIS